MEPRTRTWLGLVIGIFGSASVTGSLVAFRGRISQANVVLSFVLIAALAAFVGGRLAGVVSAVVAAGCFNFFFTLPYYSFFIKEQQDFWADLLLLASTLCVAIARHKERLAATEVATSRSEIGDLFTMARAVGGGEQALGRLAGIVAIMTEAVGAAVCRLDGKVVEGWGHNPPRVDLDRMPLLSINGWPPLEPRSMTFTEGRLPPDGALLPVWHDAAEVGYLAIFPGTEPAQLTRETARAIVVAGALAGPFLAARLLA